MKKVFMWLSSISSIMIADDMPVEMLEDVVRMPEHMAETMANLSWKVKLMMYWHSLSNIHKMIAVALIAIIVLFILCKLFKCKKKCSGC